MFGLFDSSSLEQKDGAGVWKSGLSGIIGMFVPAAFATTVAGWAANKWGDKVPESLRPITDTIASIFNGAINFIRGLFAKEELEADKGLKAQFEANPALREAAKAVGGTETQRKELVDDLKKIVENRIASDTGFWMSEDPEYAKKAAVDLRKDLSDRILESFKEANPKWSAQDLDGYQQKADKIADAISGADQLNTNTADKGYLGALLQAQKAVAAEGKMQSTFVKPINIPESAIQEALAAAPKDVTPAPEGGAPTTAGKPKATGAQAEV